MFKDLIRKIFKKTTKVVTLPAARSSGEFLLKKTDFGLVRVEFETIRKISERALSSVEGIKDCQLTVEKFSEANPLRIRLTATLLEKYSAPRVSEAADKAINAALKESLQLEFYVPVEVKVEEIAQVVAPKRRRVR